MADWRSYDAIAERYDQVWSAGFEVVARHIRAIVAPKPHHRIFDVGTGTGIVLRMLTEITDADSFAVGSDRSTAMLRRARTHAPCLHVVVADAAALPVSRAQLRCRDYQLRSLTCFQLSKGALAEALRVLMPGGTVAVSNWAPRPNRTARRGAHGWLA